jgi:hypothetical protein
VEKHSQIKGDEIALAHDELMPLAVVTKTNDGYTVARDTADWPAWVHRDFLGDEVE